LCLALQFGGINTIGFIQTLCFIPQKATTLSSTFHFARTSQNKKSFLFLIATKKIID